MAYWLRTHARTSGNRDFSRVAVRQTLGAPDVALIVKSVSMAIASHIQVQGDGMGADSGDMHVCFDERVHPLTGSSFSMAAHKEPRSAVQRLLCQVVSGMVLDTECLIVALMLLERALFAEESCLELTLYSWRPCGAPTPYRPRSHSYHHHPIHHTTPGLTLATPSPTPVRTPTPSHALRVS